MLSEPRDPSAARWMAVVLLAGLGGLPPAAAAQAERTVPGRVVEAETGAAVPNTRVATLPESDVAPAVAGAAGQFRIRVSSGGRVVATRLGFAPETVFVANEDSTIVVRMRRAPLRLDPLAVRAERPFTASSSGVVRDLDIRLRPRGSSQELLALVPGMVIAQHGGGGKAEQIFARGFDVDHGTDVAISVDGTPVNMVSHAHGQGYADLHFLIPEIVERVDVRKGPYDARDGDFATAGTVEFRTVDRLANGSAAVRAGSFGTLGTLALIPYGGGAESAGGYVAVAAQRSRGPFEAPQDYGRFNAFAKYTAPLGVGRELFASASGFGADWDASGQIPERAVRDGRISRFGAIDATEGGSTARFDAGVGIRSGSALEPWEARLYLTRYTFRLFSNFTFLLNDSIDGDGIEQVDDRYLGGFRAQRARSSGVFGLPGVRTAFVGGRVDLAAVQLNRQRERKRLGARTDDRIAQGHVFTALEQSLRMGAGVRLQLGLRADAFHHRVADQLMGAAGNGTRTEWHGIVSPKANLAWDVTEATSLFANLGTGFHSNHARDVVLAGRERVLPRAVGAEVGSRHTWDGGSVAATLWRLDLQSELVYVGDEGITEPSGRTRRFGVDLEGRVQLLPWLWGDADVNLSRGRYVDAPRGEDRIPLAPQLTSTGGLTVRDLGPWSGGARFRRIASRAAIEDASIVAYGHTLVELFAARAFRGVRINLAVDNLLNTEWNEAQFATTSRLRGEPEAVTELHFTPGAPRSFQVGLEYLF